VISRYVLTAVDTETVSDIKVRIETVDTETVSDIKVHIDCSRH